MFIIVRSQELVIQIISCYGEVEDQGFLFGDSVDDLVICDGGGVYIVSEYFFKFCLFINVQVLMVKSIQIIVVRNKDKEEVIDK